LARRNPAYDKALFQFVTATLADEDFREDLEQFVATLAEAVESLRSRRRF